MYTVVIDQWSSRDQSRSRSVLAVTKSPENVKEEIYYVEIQVDSGDDVFLW